MRGSVASGLHSGLVFVPYWSRFASWIEIPLHGFLFLSSGLCFVFEGKESGRCRMNLWFPAIRHVLSFPSASFVPLECKSCTLCCWGNKMKTWEKRDEILEWDPSGNPCSPLHPPLLVTAHYASFPATESHKCPLGGRLGSGPWEWLVGGWKSSPWGTESSCKGCLSVWGLPIWYPASV